MRCTVVWLRGAEDELARIWMQAADPTAVTDSANEIDHFAQKVRIDGR